MNPLTASESDLLDRLGKYPFLWKGCIRNWNPGVPCVSATLDDNDARVSTNKELLTRIGAAFSTMHELRAWAAANNWPRHERIPDLDQAR